MQLNINCPKSSLLELGVSRDGCGLVDKFMYVLKLQL